VSTVAGAIAAVALVLYGWAPTAARNEHFARFVRLGPRVSAQLIIGGGATWEPGDGKVAKLRRLIALTPDDDPQKPDLWFRVGEASAWWWEHSIEGFNISHQRHQAYFSEALDALHAALSFRGYDRIDAVLFELARLHLAAEDGESARPYVDRLHAEHPTSRYVPKVDAMYADYLFSRQELAAALAWYSAVDDSKDFFMQAYALYGKGWCFLRRGDVEAARFALAEAVRIADQTDKWSGNRVVRRQAWGDLVRVSY
jgi:tetratricopeptide (TPR) repeat protein